VIAEVIVTHDGLVLEEVVYRLSGNGGGSAGQTQLDLLLDGATLYPSFALDDQRPSWPFDAVTLSSKVASTRSPSCAPDNSSSLPPLTTPPGGHPAGVRLTSFAEGRDAPTHFAEATRATLCFAKQLERHSALR
jgi:hypothetical protein